MTNAPPCQDSKDGKMTPSGNSANDDSYAGTTSETTRKNVTETLRLMPLQAEWREVLSHLGFRVQDIRRLDGEKKYRGEVLLKPVNPFISTSGLGHFERGYSIPEIIELAKKTGNTFELLEKALEFAFREIQGIRVGSSQPTPFWKIFWRKMVVVKIDS